MFKILSNLFHWTFEYCRNYSVQWWVKSKHSQWGLVWKCTVSLSLAHIPRVWYIRRRLSKDCWKYFFQRMEGVEQKPLKYSIHACSSHSGTQPPTFPGCVSQNPSFQLLTFPRISWTTGHPIRHQGTQFNTAQPCDPQLCALRWSSDTNSPPQYLVLR